LVLACLSPTIRCYLRDIEEPSIILPEIKVSEMQYFVECLTSFGPGNIYEHQDLLRVLGASTSGWTPEVRTGSGVKAEDDEEASDILRTAQNLSLMSPLTWRSTTLQLTGTNPSSSMGVSGDNPPSSMGVSGANPPSSMGVSGANPPASMGVSTDHSLSVANGEHLPSNHASNQPSNDRTRSLAMFSLVTETDTDRFNDLFMEDSSLKDKVDMYIGQTEDTWVCKLATCTYSNRKRVLVKYHVLAHLNINAFKPPKRKDSSYLEFIQSHFKKKSKKLKAGEKLDKNDEIEDDIQDADDDIPVADDEAIDDTPASILPDQGVEDPASGALDIPTAIPLDLKATAPVGKAKKVLKKKKPKKLKTTRLSPSFKKKSNVEEMSEENKARCDEFIVFKQNTREYKCVYPDCTYSHRSKTWLKYHVMKHLNISEFLCEECGESFPLQKLLRKHVMAIHGSDELRAAIEEWIVEDMTNPTWFRCTHLQCGFAAATKKGAGLHALNEHMEKSFICDLCGQGFVTERSLVNHTNYHHNKGRPTGQLYPCSFCQKSFRTVSYLEAHENEHRGLRPYQCDACGKSFASNGMLRSHKFAHAPKIFKCDCCDQAFPRKNTLMVHLRAVHMHEKPYECDICGQKFPRSSSMTRHRRIHTGLPRYQCHYCDKSTTQRGDLNRHMAKAHGWPARDLRQQQPNGLVTQLAGPAIQTIVNI